MKKIYAVMLTFALAILIFQAGVAWSVAPVSGKTSVYPNVPVNITIVSLKQVLNSTYLEVKIDAPAGYQTSGSPALLQPYISAGCVLDCSMAEVTTQYWFNANNGASSSTKVAGLTHNIPLRYSDGYYIGNITFSTSFVTHSLIVYAIEDQSMLSFNKMDWGAFLDPVNFTLVPATNPPATPTQNPTLSPSQSQFSTEAVVGGVILVIIVISAVALLISRKKSKTQLENPKPT
jgi:hypothetical protein